VRCKGGPIDNAVTGVPSSARAGTIEQHLDPTLNTERHWFQTAARAGKLAERENRECGGNDACKDCQNSFELILTLGEHDKSDIRCPKCGSKNVEQDAAAFYAVTSKKS